MITAFLSLGSNLGDCRRNLQQALTSMFHSGVRLERISRLYLSQPVGVAHQPPFSNCACEIQTGLRPEDLLRLCLQVETDLGRDRSRRWAPRTIDIDIVYFGHWIIREAGLVVPHPRLHLRRFVLTPLVEIAPDFKDPLQGKPARQLLEECTDPHWVKTVGSLSMVSLQ